MRRRDFLALGGAGVLGAAAFPQLPVQAAPAIPASQKIAWQPHGQTGLIEQVMAGGEPLVRGNRVGLLDGFCRLASNAGGPPVTLTAAQPTGGCGAVQLRLLHRLLTSGAVRQENVLEAMLTLHNVSDRARRWTSAFSRPLARVRGPSSSRFTLPSLRPA